MSQEQKNGYESDPLSQDSDYQGAATGRDEPDIFHDDDIVEIALRLAPESESSDFSDFTEEEEKKEQPEAQVNQGQHDEGEDGDEDWGVEAEQEENNSYWVFPEESEHEPPNEA